MVPAGFTITTEACVEYMRLGRMDPNGLAGETAQALERLERDVGTEAQIDTTAKPS